MDDPYHPVPAGTIGIVDHIDDAGTIHMKWENGSSLGLIEGQDQFEVIETQNQRQIKRNGEIKMDPRVKRTITKLEQQKRKKDK